MNGQSQATVDVVNVVAGDGDGDVLYLYGIVRADQTLPDRFCGATAHVRHLGLTALVERVPARDFTAEILAEKLTSVAWVTELATRHELALTAAMLHGPVLPARLCTLFTGVEAVRARLSEQEEVITATLDRLGHRREWALKLFCDRARLAAELEADCPVAAELIAAEERATPGQRYLLTKKRAAHVEALVEARIGAIQDEAFSLCEALELPACARALLPSDPKCDDGGLFASFAVLADPDERNTLDDLMVCTGAGVGGAAFLFEITGPWAPYSFVTAEDSEPSPGSDSDDEDEEEHG